MSVSRILLVEDSLSQAETTRTFLEKHGYVVVWVKDGTSALIQAKNEVPDVILLDLLLPGINGNEVCRRLKLDPATRAVPIIMLTVRSAVEDKVTSLEAGADDYLPKPYSEVELNARIYAALRTKALTDELRERNSQMEELLAKVEILAITDSLSGLYNRRKFEAILSREVKEALRYHRPLACLMIDVDHFKEINDRFGHGAGDVTLKELAALLRDSLREIDTLARWGGEEFIALLPQTPLGAAQEAAARLLRAVSSARFSRVGDRKVTISIGLAAVEQGFVEPERLVGAADFALYRAKHNGRDRVEQAEPLLTQG